MINCEDKYSKWKHYYFKILKRKNPSLIRTKSIHIVFSQGQYSRALVFSILLGFLKPDNIMYSQITWHYDPNNARY